MILSQATITKITEYCRTNISEWQAKYETFDEFIERMMSRMVEVGKIHPTMFQLDDHWNCGVFYSYARRAENQYYDGI